MKSIIILKTVTVINVMVASGFAIAGIIAPAAIIPAGVPVNQGTNIFALYAAARTIPIAIIAIYIVIGQRKEALFTVAGLTALIQFTDGFIGIYQQNASKIYGPFVLGIAGFVSLYYALKNA